MNKRWLLVGGMSFAMAGLTQANVARAEDTVNKEEKDGKAAYEADATTDGRKIDILLDEEGTLVSKKSDNEEGEHAGKHEAKARRDGEEEERGEAEGRHERGGEYHHEGHDGRHEKHGPGHGHHGGASADRVKRLLAQIHEVREELDKLECQVKELAGGRRSNKAEPRHARHHEEGRQEKQHHSDEHED
jgi:hypothetical protein